MLREVIDMASLEDFVSGLARAARLRVCAYDSHGQLIVASPPDNDFALLTRHVLDRLPPHMDLVPVPAHDPPGAVAFVETEAVWYVVAPVYAEDHRVAGYIGIGEFRDTPPTAEHWQLPEGRRGVNRDTLAQAWEKLPLLDRRGQAQSVVTARWGARQLAEWSRRESRLLAATDQVALVGDIAELLTGEQDLQKVVRRIVAETARVMQCPFCSMRLYDPKTDELTIKAVHNLPAQYMGKGAVVRAASPVDDQALKGNIVYVEDAGDDPRVPYPEEFRRHGLVSMLTAGMIYRGQPVGVIRVYTKRRRRFRKMQRDLLRAVAYQAATAIVHAQLVDERLRNAETQRQLALAGELQERMIRIPPPRHPRVDTALAFHPTYDVAGDFCDFLTLGDGRLIALVADVAGKGVPASLLMSSVRGALRAAVEYCAGPGELLTRLNRQLCRETLPSEFVTLLLITIDRAARHLTYVNAGHEPLLLLRGGQVRPLSEGNLVLGIDPREQYQEHPLALLPNDLLLLYTDGANEARNFAGAEFTRERLWQALRAYGDLIPPQVLQNIVWDIRRFVGLAEQTDDLTLVALRILPEPRS
jgi:sigma-B regulation protein RsbU (phosphoserine phosphatase)